MLVTSMSQSTTNIVRCVLSSVRCPLFKSRIKNSSVRCLYIWLFIFVRFVFESYNISFVCHVPSSFKFFWLMARGTLLNEIIAATLFTKIAIGISARVHELVELHLAAAILATSTGQRAGTS